MKFIHDGVTCDFGDKPEFNRYEFNEYRHVKYNEKYLDNGHIKIWLVERLSMAFYWIATKIKAEIPPTVEGWAFLDDKPRHPKEGESYYSDISQRVFLADYNLRCNKYWIATKVKPKKPTVEGWAFLDDKPRCPKEGESYYVSKGEAVVTAPITFTELKYWIATKVKPKGRKVVRYEIKLSIMNELHILNSSYDGVDEVLFNPDFIGFEFEYGVVQQSPILYYNRNLEIFIFQPSFKEIESGKVEVRHALYGLFFE